MGWFTEDSPNYHFDFLDIKRELASMRQEIRAIKTHLDDSIKLELDSIQSKYIKFLEDKLIRFDEDLAHLKNEKEERYKKLFVHFTTNKN